MNYLNFPSRKVELLMTDSSLRAHVEYTTEQLRATVCPCLAITCTDPPHFYVLDLRCSSASEDPKQNYRLLDQMVRYLKHESR